MSDDILTLGGIQFVGFSPPDRMMGGGKQAMVVHKLPGGSRVIDTLGPDEDDVVWNGHFFGDDAEDNALALDAMRAAGQVVALTYAGQYRSVIVSHFRYYYRRRPVWIEYEITCTVYVNPSLGNLTTTTSTLDNLVASDLGSAAAIAAGDISGSIP